jgi:hypothetical protein
MAVSLIQTLQDEIKSQGYEARSRVAREWFREKVRELSGRINREKLLSDPAFKLKDNPIWGQILMFVYRAKNRETLEYYDRFPLALMISEKASGFLGLNLHYLEPMTRAVFLDRLMDILGQKELDFTTRLRVTYQLLQKTKKFREFWPCLHEYRYDCITSKIVQVSAADWPVAVFLPTEYFSGAPKTQVWRESRDIFLNK